jgi:hypothetical protein
MDTMSNGCQYSNDKPTATAAAKGTPSPETSTATTPDTWAGDKHTTWNGESHCAGTVASIKLFVKRQASMAFIGKSVPVTWIVVPPDTGPADGSRWWVVGMITYSNSAEANVKLLLVLKTSTSTSPVTSAAGEMQVYSVSDTLDAVTASFNFPKRQRRLPTAPRPPYF